MFCDLFCVLSSQIFIKLVKEIWLFFFSLLMVIYMICDVYVIFLQIKPFCLTILLLRRKIESEFKNSVLFPLKVLFPEIFVFFEKMYYCFL